MIEEKRDISFKKTIGWYSLLWLLFFGTCVLYFYMSSGKNFFPDDDGLHQQYPYFVYTGIWIRRLFNNIFVKHIFEIPMWDMSIGMGADPLIAFSVGSDPLSWISAIIPIKYSEFAFDVLIALKFYLSGLVFVFLGHSKGFRSISIIAGALVYVFSSIMYLGFSQAGFINIFILFPLLMIGVDRLWNNKGFGFYVVILACCVFSSTYFTFMFGLLVIVYCFIRFLFEKRVVKGLGPLLVRFISCTLLGIAIGIGPTLPANINLTTLDRFDIEHSYTIFSLKGMDSLFIHLFTYINRNGIFWGVSSIVVISLIVLFLKRKENTNVKVLFILYSVAFLFPIVGSVFNGMNFSSERYIFGYILLLAYIVMLVFDDLEIFKGKIWYLSLLAGCIYLVYTVLSSDITAMLSGASLLLCCLLIGIINSITKLNKDLKERSYIAVLFVTCFIMSYAGLGRAMTTYSVPLGQADDIMMSSTGDDLLDGYDLTNIRFDRIPYSYPEIQVNSSMITGRYGFDFYHSNYNSYVHQFYYDIGSSSNDVNTYRGFKGKTYADLICGTEYIVRNIQEDRCVKAPYSYSEIADNGEYALYRADQDTSLVYFYDESISYEVYDSLPIIEREELMMRYCVTSDGSSEAVSSSDRYDQISFEISDISGLEFDGKNVTVSEPGGYIELDFDEVIDSETDLYIEGFTGSTTFGEMYYQVAIAQLSGDEIRTADFWVGISESYRYYQGPCDLLFNFGYDESSVDAIRIYINTPGQYSIDDIKIYTRSAGQLDKTISEFSGHSKTEDIDYVIDGNHISIKAFSDSDKYLYIAVPYSEGWSAAVDGKEVEILRANRAFMAIPIDAGDHEVKLSYSTPYLKTGYIISSVSVLFFVGVICVGRKTRTKNNV